jgi:hypothetical protein
MTTMTDVCPRLYIHTQREGCRRRRHEVRVTDAVNIEGLLRGEGFDTPGALARAREALQAAGLTRAGKRAIAAEKVGRVQELLDATLLRACSQACIDIDRAGPGAAREAVTVSRPSCEVCGGSNNRRAGIAMLRALRRKGVRRVVIVGGTPHLWKEAREQFADAPEIAVRYVDGTDTSHSGKDALTNKRWAQLIVIWASTPLKHAVSNHYSHEIPDGVRLVTVNPRGFEGLCGEVVKTYT